MSHQPIEQAIAVHDELPSSSLRGYLLLLAAPLLLLVAVELFQRAFVASEQRLSMPWETRPPLHEPNTTIHESFPGDLLVMAGLPAFDKQFSHIQQIECVTDADGYRAVPRPGEAPASVWVCGASFFDSATTNERMFASVLDGALGEHTVANKALLGSTAESALRAVTGDDFANEPPKVLVWGGVLRLWHGSFFRPTLRQIDEAGERVDSTLTRLLPYRTFHNNVEGYLRTNSLARRAAGTLSPFLPPMSLDLGRKSDSVLAHYGERPMMFLTRSMQSANLPLAERAPATMLAAIRRVHARCERLGVKLLVAIVPDKYELYRDGATLISRPNDQQLDAPRVRPAVELQGALAEHGIDCIDLLPVLRAAQRANGDNLLYYADDTHWTDDGMRIAAEHVAPFVQRLLGE